jgi:hypothetical protein
VKTSLRICRIVFLCLLAGAQTLLGQPFLQHREHVLLDRWKFHKGHIQAAEHLQMPSTDGWQDVSVPHTWNAQDVLTEGPLYYQGICWYRTGFTLSPEKRAKRTFVRFEGVSLVADVFLNGEYLGEHKGGYSAFCFEITGRLRYGEENVLAVKVDNTMQPDVAPSGTDLYPLFGGIYRPVALFHTNRICISPLDYASSGVTVRSLEVSGKRAEFGVETLVGYRDEPAFVSTSPYLLPPRGMPGAGLYGEYFDNNAFQGQPKHTRVDTAVSFTYGAGGAFADMPVDNFSVRWTGRLIPPASGIYRFMLKSDDGSRLSVNGKRIIDHWGTHAATEKTCEVKLEAGKEVSLQIEYFESGAGASVLFGWMVPDASRRKATAVVRTSIFDKDGKTPFESRSQVSIDSGGTCRARPTFVLYDPHLWNAKADPHLYRVNVRVEDGDGRVLDEVEEPFGLRYYRVDKDSGLVLNGRACPVYGVCRHQEWQGLGPALSDKHHERDVDLMCEMGATGVRLAHYQQADKMYSLCDERGLIVWAEIPNTPAYRRHPAYLENCRTQLTELIKQNINHPSILFWGMYNEVDIPNADLKLLHDTAKKLDPSRLTTQADYSQVSDRHLITDVAAWNWYFGWYYGQFGEYGPWFERARQAQPTLKAGLSEYGAGGCVSQQQENPGRPDANSGHFWPEQYQRLYHEKVWSEIKGRKDIWCKFIWNLADFSWTNVQRGDRNFINHKGLITHDRQVKKDAYFFYTANWSTDPVLYVLSRRNVDRKEALVPVEVYTNLPEVELSVNGVLVSKKGPESNTHKISWEHVQLAPGRNRIEVVAHQGGKTYADSCEWVLRVKGE